MFRPIQWVNRFTVMASAYALQLALSLVHPRDLGVRAKINRIVWLLGQLRLLGASCVAAVSLNVSVARVLVVFPVTIAR